MIIPKDISKTGIIIEFKRSRATTDIKKIVIVFKGKQVSVNNIN